MFNQNVIILKELSKDSNNVKKRLVKKFNINLDSGTQEESKATSGRGSINLGQYSARTVLNETSSPG